MAVSFNIDALRALANKTSYDRGRSYYRQGAVGKIKQKGPVFSAKVKGSEAYHVSLDLGGRAVKSECSCPYDWDGVCKHVVALALAVLDQFDLRQLPSAPGQVAVAAIWDAVPEARKLDFLRAELRRDPDLAQRFGLLLTPAGAPAVSGPPARSGPQRMAEELAALEFDEDLSESLGYYEDYEEVTSASFDDLIVETMQPCVDELTVLAQSGLLLPPLAYWVDATTALLAIEVPRADDFELFDDYGAHLLDVWQRALDTAGWPDMLEFRTFTSADAVVLEPWLVEHLQSAAADLDVLEPHWEQLLLALAFHPMLAEVLARGLPVSALTPKGRARVLVQAGRTLRDDPLWVENAELLIEDDADLTQELLDFFEGGDAELIIQPIVRRAYKAWPDRFRAYADRWLPADERQRLEAGILRYRCRTRQSWEDFERLMQLLPPEEMRAYAEEQLKATPHSEAALLFLGRIQHWLRRPDAMLVTLRGLDLLRFPNLAAYLELLVPFRPAEALDRVAAYVEQAVGQHTLHHRGTYMYEQIAAWLTVLNRQAELREQVRAITDHLTEQYPQLNVLKKNLREAGLLAQVPRHVPLPAEPLPPRKAAAKPGRKPRR